MPASKPCLNVHCFRLRPCPEHPERKPFARMVKYAGGSGWQAKRRRILERDGYQCRLNITGCTGRAEVVDHILNRARGLKAGISMAQLDADQNLIAACKSCNV